MDYSDEPIPLIELVQDEDLKVVFKLREEGAAFLRAMTSKKIAVLTISGPQRSGKSFLANRFLHKMNGFAIGPSTMPCTHGIWIWGKPISVNSEIDLLILDTEGLNSTRKKRDQNIDAQLFTIALLLSSYFIYNSFGHIDETAIENLSLVVQLGKNVTLSTDSQNEADLARYFPHFHWVLRDFSLNLNGRSPREYLESALNFIDKGNDKETLRKNQIRDKIKKYFQSRECTCLIRPLNDEKLLAYIEKEKWEDLRPEFTENVEILVNDVLKSIRPKVIKGQPLTGLMLLNLLNTYLTSINTGGTPQILTTMERVIFSEIDRISGSIKKEYDAQIKSKLSLESLPLAEEDINKIHNDILANAYKQLKVSGDIIGPREIQSIQQKLSSYFNQTISNILQLNSEKITQVAIKCLNQFINKQKIPNPDEISEGFGEIKLKLLNQFRENYNEFFNFFSKELKGSTKKYQAFAENIPRFMLNYFSEIFKIAETIHEREIENYKQQISRVREGEANLKKIILDTQSHIDLLQEDLKDTEREKEKLKQQIKLLNENFEEERNNQASKYRELEIYLKSEKEKNEKLYEELQAKGTKESKNRFEIEQKIADLTKENKLFFNTVEKLKSEIDRLTIQKMQLQDKIEDLEENKINISKTNTTRADEYYDKSLLSEVEELKQKIIELENAQQSMRENLNTSENTQNKEVEISEPEEPEFDDNILNEIPNHEIRAKFEIIWSNYKKQKLNFDKLAKKIMGENNKLKAEIIDSNKKLSAKEAELKNLSGQVENLNLALDSKKFEDESQKFLMQIVELKSLNVELTSYKENLIYFFRELLLKVVKKKKETHYAHALSNLNEEDRITIQEILSELNIKT